jgi:putative transposase
MSKINPFKYYKTSPEIIKLAVMYYVRYPLSLRQVEDILHERGIDICHETVRYWWNKFGTLFAKEMKKKPTYQVSNWRWHIDEVFVKINGELHYLWRAVDQEGTILDCYVSKRRNKKAALKVLKKLMSRHGIPKKL